MGWDTFWGWFNLNLVISPELDFVKKASHSFEVTVTALFPIEITFIYD